MNLTDFYFLLAFAIILPIYYFVPRKIQWGVILVGSIAFYLVSGHPALILYPVISVCIVYACTAAFERLSADPANKNVPAGQPESADASVQPAPEASSGTGIARKKRIVLTVGIVLMIMVLIVLKYLRQLPFISLSASGAAAADTLASGADASTDGSLLSMLIVPLGLSYYTFTLISYMVDVYNGIAVPQKNLLKLMTFGMYAPSLVSGPIMQYREAGTGFFEEHAFSIEELSKGMQRMLWGFFKKLVIAERLGVIVASVYDDPASFGGHYIWAIIICFTIQLYADFSGLMDIVLGISQCLGIKLPENFDTPFFSQTIAELWRRWHITLGVWFKEYVFYPILRSRLHMSLQGRLKTAFTRGGDDKKAKKKAKRLSTFAAMFVLWFTVGLWHGANLTYVIGSGLLQWFYIVMEEVLESPFKSLWTRLKIDPDCRVLRGLRMIRTFLLFSFGMAFFRAASVGDALCLIGAGFHAHNPGLPGLIQGMIAAAGEEGIRGLNQISILGLSYIDMLVLALSLAVLFIVDIIKSKTDVREAIAARPVVIRFIIWFALLFFVILMGQYGPGYNAADFIYQGF